MKNPYGTWAVEEPVMCSQGGIPYNKAHLDAKDVRIAHLAADNGRLRAALTDARSFVEGMVTPVKGGVMQISSYHPCHALIDKIDAALASAVEQTVECTQCETPVAFGACCPKCGKPTDE